MAAIQQNLFEPTGFDGMNAEKFDGEWRQSCHVAPVGHREIDWMVKRHYIGKWPGVCVLSLGMWFRDALVGAAVYALPPMQTSTRYGGETWELARLWISDDIPCNAETWLIAQSIRYIAAQFPAVKYLVSYADPSAGHEGMIYKASNWTPDGQTDEGRKTPRCDYEHGGKMYSRKSHVPEGVVPNRIPRVSKHRFYYELSRYRKAPRPLVKSSKADWEALARERMAAAAEKGEGVI